MKKPSRGRNLALIRESGSTARVLNLVMLHERHGDEPGYQANPLFKNVKLNRALILKHTLRPEERDLFSRPRMSATKVVLPFASSDLRLGGTSFFVEQEKFERILKEAAGDYAQPSDFDSDLQMLRLLDSVPSFDPFLMRERLRQSGFEPDRAYFDVAEADVARMRAFVSREISQLIELAFVSGGPAARELSTKLAEKLMTDETAKALDPLRQTLRLADDDYREGVFAWRGFLYYKWLVADFDAMLKDLSQRIQATRIMKASPSDVAPLAEMRDRIIANLRAAAARVEESLLEYGVAFAGLAEGKPTLFRDFLLRAPAMFVPIGEAVGVIKHIQSFWNFRFPEGSLPLIDLDEAYEIFHDFDATLRGVEFVSGGAKRARAS